MHPPLLHISYTFFHICNTFITLLSHHLYTFVTLLLHLCFTLITLLVHPLLHICNTRFTRLLHPLLQLRYTVVTLIITILMHSYSVAFCPCLICGILSGIHIYRSNENGIYYRGPLHNVLALRCTSRTFIYR